MRQRGPRRFFWNANRHREHGGSQSARNSQQWASAAAREEAGGHAPQLPSSRNRPQRHSDAATPRGRRKTKTKGFTGSSGPRPPLQASCCGWGWKGEKRGARVAAKVHDFRATPTGRTGRERGRGRGGGTHYHRKASPRRWKRCWKNNANQIVIVFARSENLCGSIRFWSASVSGCVLILENNLADDFSARLSTDPRLKKSEKFTCTSDTNAGTADGRPAQMQQLGGCSASPTFTPSPHSLGPAVLPARRISVGRPAGFGYQVAAFGDDALRRPDCKGVLSERQTPKHQQKISNHTGTLGETGHRLKGVGRQGDIACRAAPRAVELGRVGTNVRPADGSEHKSQRCRKAPSDGGPRLQRNIRGQPGRKSSATLFSEKATKARPRSIKN